MPRPPISKQYYFDLCLKVSNLFDVDGWKMDKLEELFVPQDIAQITAMVSIEDLEDDYVWAFNNNGDYSVKSGYWFITNHPLLPPVERSAQNTKINMLKSRVWNLKTGPKIKLLCWRALSGALSVAERLSTRGIQLDTNCQICGQIYTGANSTINSLDFMGNLEESQSYDFRRKSMEFSSSNSESV